MRLNYNFMGLFNLRKNKTPKPEILKVDSKADRKLKVISAANSPVLATLATDASFQAEVSNVIMRPRITEKGTLLSNKSREVYVFEVSRNATKKKVRLAVNFLYKVEPVKISIVKIPPKTSTVRGRTHKGKTGYKAYIYLKEGDRIEVL